MPEIDTTSVYLHVPFCKRICIYCDFFVTTARKQFVPFFEALEREIDLVSKDGTLARVETVYFGGGTPSVLPLPMLQKILKNLHQAADIRTTEFLEVTIEANPSEANIASLQGFRALGVNRLSLGVQSFNDDDLRFLTRTHNSVEATQTFVDARRAGFENISIDLMFGIPGQTAETWTKTVDQAISLEPEHISTYSLTFEKGTALEKMRTIGKVEPVDDELYLSMYLYLCQRLKENGYDHYEISNFAKPGYQSKHNQRYWGGSPYMGLGPSAHSMAYEEGNRVRKWNVSDLQKYIALLSENKSAVAEKETLRLDQEMTESLFLGLRTRSGIAFRSFSERYSVDIEDALGRISEQLRRFILIEEEQMSLTTEGMFVCDEICVELLRRLP